MKNLIAIAAVFFVMCAAPRPYLVMKEVNNINSIYKDDFVYDKVLIANMAIRAFKRSNIDFADPRGKITIKTIVGIADDECHSNGGDIVYVAFDRPNDSKTYDAIVQVKSGAYLGVLKANYGHDKPVEEMINYLRYSPSCVSKQLSSKPMLSILNTIPCSSDGKSSASLWCAVKDGQIETAISLIGKGADVNFASSKGVPLLMAASLISNEQLVKLLLQKGANIKATDSSGRNVLYYAIQTQNIRLVDYLVERGADPDGLAGDSVPLLVYYAQRIIHQIDSTLIMKSTNVNATDRSGFSALHRACENGNLQMVKLLISKGADVNLPAIHFDSITPMYGAAQKGYLEVVEELCGHGANVNFHTMDGKTALRAALSMGQNETVVFLISKGANVDAKDNNGETALLDATHYGSEKGNDEIIRALINAKASVNEKDISGKTPMMWAAKRYYTWTAIKVLLGAGADIGIKDNDGKSAYDYATQNPALSNSKNMVLLRHD